MKKIFKLLMILSFITLFSQQKTTIKPIINPSAGYELAIKTENLEGKTIKLSIYSGNYRTVYRIDSVKVNKNIETVTFKQKQNVISTIYQLSITGKTQKTDIFVGNGDKINFKINGDNIETISTENLLNKAFFEYQKKQNGEEKTAFLVNLQKKYPQNKALKIFSLFEVRKTTKLANNQTLADFRNLMLKDIDVDDKAISLMPNAYSFLNNFFTSGEINSENYKAGIDLFFKNQTCTNNNFKFYTNWIFKNVDLLQTRNINDVPDYLFNKYINNTTCITKAKDFYDASLKKIQSYSKNPVGSVLTDFEMQTIDNKDFNLNGFAKEKVNLVVFYDPLCSHCITEIPKITQEISDLEKETQLKVGKIAILNVFNKMHWQEFVKKNQLENWMNVTYKDGDTKTQEKLDVFSNPNYFILDKNGRILLKTYNLSFIKNYLIQ